MHLIDPNEFTTWINDTDTTAHLIGAVNYIITDPPWDILPNSEHDKVYGNMYADVAAAVERLLRPGGNP